MNLNEESFRLSHFALTNWKEVNLLTLEQIEKITKLLENNDSDSEFTHLTNNVMDVSHHLGDVIILSLEKGWSLDELKNIAKIILELQ